MESSSQPRGRILVADDEEAFRESTVVLLRREGYHCDGVATAEAVTAAIARENYDLLISDIRMPGNTNLELIESLQQMAPRLPTILVMGYPSVHTAVPAIELGIAAYLVKPVSPEELITLAHQNVADLRSALPGSASVEASGEPAQPPSGFRAGAGPGDPGMGDHLRQAASLTLKDLESSLAQLQSLIEVITRLPLSPSGLQQLESHEPAVLTAALMDAVRSIERTRHSFKSQELASLRQQLESLVHEIGNPPRRPSTAAAPDVSDSKR
jgi:CheY-like chemotaxis protein